MHNVVRSVTLFSISIIALSSCSANDINIKSKSGESISVPLSSINVSTFDKENAINSYNKWLSRIEKGLKGCLNDFPNKKMCKQEYNKAIAEKTNQRDSIMQMPDISIIKYDAKIKSLNGNTKNKNNSYVACLPDSVSKDQSKWKTIIVSVNDLNESSMGSIQFNTGKNNESIDSILCQEYSTTI